MSFCHAQIPSGYYDTQRIVWYDRHDTQGSPWLDAMDKRKHFAAGAIIGASVKLMAEAAGLKHPFWWGFAAAVAAGIVKEMVDYKRWPYGFTPGRGSGTAEIMDAVWTGAGGAAGAYVMQVKFKF